MILKICTKHYSIYAKLKKTHDWLDNWTGHYERTTFEFKMSLGGIPYIPTTAILSNEYEENGKNIIHMI